MSAVSSILIIGAGQAAAVAADTLRKKGYSGKIVIVGNEMHAPYERPPLSKAVLAGDEVDEPSVSIKDGTFFDTGDIDLMLGVQVTGLDPSVREATLADGSILGFDRCLLATGGKARELPGLSPDAPQTHYLRTLDDARRLRSALQQASSAIVIGAGVLGLEIASTACNMGVDVSVIETAPRVLGRMAPSAFSSWLQTRILASGARLYLGQSITGVELSSRIAKVVLSHGAVLEADIIVVAVGFVPATHLAQQAGLRINKQNGGIEVDARCRSSQPAIFAAGDCTSRSVDGCNSLRLESWQNANEQGRIAACAMLDLETTPAAYPWFWTDQFGCNIQMLGLPRPDLQYVVRGSIDPAVATPQFIMLGLHGSSPRHALAVNAGGDLRAMRPMLERQLSVDTFQFTDRSTTVKAYTKALIASVSN
ncbi:MAG: ferredoxin reductase [Burkholderiaceae bacterium]|nr:MAG: ferredoxin reductase [Burkholderiaceae bacterium]